MATREHTEDAASRSPGGARGVMVRLRRDRALALIAVAGVVALVVRLAWVVWVGDRPPQTFVVDPGRYLGYAESIARGDGYASAFADEPTAYYPPGYPYFLGLLRLVHRVLPGEGSFPYFVALVQAGIGAALAPLGGIVARRVVSPAAGVVAAFGLALYPNLVFHSAAVLGETLYNTLFMAFLALAVSRRPGAVPSVGRAALVGVPFTLAVLVRPISLAVLPVLVLCWWLSARDGRATLRATAAVLGVMAVALVPWTIRNAVQLDAFVPMSTNTGDNLCIGHSPIANGGFVVCPATDGPHLGRESELRNDRDKTREALAWIRANPGEEPRLAWRRFEEMFLAHGDHDALAAIQYYPNPYLGTEAWMAPATERRLRRVADTAYLVVVVAGLVGTVRLVRCRWPDGLLVVLAGVTTAVVPLMFFGDPRFKVPVVPILCLAAAAAVTWPFDRRRRPAGTATHAVPSSADRATAVAST